MSHIPARVRAELDQTPAWWDQQYGALIRKQIPTDADYHDSHNIIEHRTYANLTVRRECADCCVSIDPYTLGDDDD